MKVFLDTNVLASAFATRGLCSDVLREVFASHDLYTSIEVLKELRGVLKNKFGFPENLIKKIFLLLQREANMAYSQEQVKIHIKDKADIPIVNAAMAAGIHVFVTEDKELQDLARIGNLKIISPRKFWEILKIQ
jgi:putative PIN family toxin of toxin-antitoxin system